MTWLSRHNKPGNVTENTAKRTGVPEGIWDACPSCKQAHFLPELVKNMMVCPKCHYHYRVSARERIQWFLDEGNQTEIAKEVVPVDALKFKDTKAYKDRLKEAQKATGEVDAMVVIQGTLKKMPVVVSAFEFDFLGGSMGSVVGERFVRGVNAAIEAKCPYVCFSASGGARMQESLFSLMQMVKVSAALGKLREKGLPYIVILADPTMGGVSASLAMLGDLHIAEPNALIGFAGPRVIEQTVRQKLPPGFQRSEFVQEKGMIDMIVHRKDLPHAVGSVLSKLMHTAEPV